MKKCPLLFIIATLFCIPLQGQTTAFLAPGGGGPYEVAATDQCLKAEDRAMILSLIHI